MLERLLNLYQSMRTGEKALVLVAVLLLPFALVSTQAMQKIRKQFLVKLT